MRGKIQGQVTWEPSRRALLTALPLSLGLLALPARAEDYLVLGHELVELLRGRSIEGTWNDRAYVQYFGPTGRTAFRWVGAPVEWGTWHLGDTGNYCSRWPRGGMACYKVIKRDDDYYWEPVKGGDRQPFSVHDGNLVSGN